MLHKSCLVLIAAACLMAGCTATSVNLKFIAVEPVNELQPGESRNVDVRVYQLKDEAKFKAATVDELWVNAETVLAEQLIEVKLGESIYPEKPGAPKGREIIIDPLKPECKFIGVLALFQTGDEVGERKLVVPVKEAGSVTFELTGNHIAVKK